MPTPAINGTTAVRLLMPLGVNDGTTEVRLLMPLGATSLMLLGANAGLNTSRCGGYCHSTAFLRIREYSERDIGFFILNQRNLASLTEEGTIPSQNAAPKTLAGQLHFSPLAYSMHE